MTFLDQYWAVIGSSQVTTQHVFSLSTTCTHKSISETFCFGPSFNAQRFMSVTCVCSVPFPVPCFYFIWTIWKTNPLGCFPMRGTIAAMLLLCCDIKQAFASCAALMFSVRSSAEQKHGGLSENLLVPPELNPMNHMASSNSSSQIMFIFNLFKMSKTVKLP